MYNSFIFAPESKQVKSHFSESFFHLPCEVVESYSDVCERNLGWKFQQTCYFIYLVQTCSTACQFAPTNSNIQTRRDLPTRREPTNPSSPLKFRSHRCCFANSRLLSLIYVCTLCCPMLTVSSRTIVICPEETIVVNRDTKRLQHEAGSRTNVYAACMASCPIMPSS